MLFTLGLLLLLTPLPSFQTTTNEKRDARGSNVTKTNTVLTLLKPKTTATPSKQSVHSTPKPNTENVTVLPTPASNQKLQTMTTKVRISLPVNQTTQSAAVKTTKTTSTIVNKDKHKVNQTDPAKLPLLGEFKDKPAPTRAPNVQSTTTKVPPTSKITRNKPQQSSNHTSSPKSSTTSGEKTMKDKPAHSDQSTSVKPASASNSKVTKTKATASVSQTVVAGLVPSSDKPAPAKVPTVQLTSTKGDRADSSAAVKDEVTGSANHTSTPSTSSKEKPAPSQPMKVVISTGCDSSQAKGQDVTLKPGNSLVLTHKISLLPGDCTGECESEMADLKRRVAKLEKDMSFLIEKCPCSANCPHDCSGNGKCEKGKCICEQGFMGPDCSRCTQGAVCSKEVNKMPDNTEPNLTQQVDKDKKNFTKMEENEKRHEAKDPHATTHSDITLNSDRRKSEETHQGKPESKDISPSTDSKLDKKKISGKFINSDHLKDDPRSNITQSIEKRTNSTSKIENDTSQTTRGKKNKNENESVEKMPQTEKNDTRSAGNKQTKTDKPEKKNEPSSDKSKTQGGSEKEKDVQKNPHVTNKTPSTTTVKTNIHKIKPTVSRTVRTGGLGSVKAENISSYSFTVTWLAPYGMFKNFTVIRKESISESDKGVEASKRASNSTEAQSKSTNITMSSGKTTGFKGKTETKRISMVIPGNVRSVEFSNLRANTHYTLQIHGTTADRRSKIHRITATTGPEPPTELVFSNVTEHSLAVSWTKPKTVFTGFRVTYINMARGKSRSVTVGSQQSHVVLSELSAGSSYVISITSTKGSAQSDELTSVVTTVPAPPTHLQVNNVTDTRALLQWTPSLGRVDRFIISYESSKTPNVTVTVMLSGNSVQYELKGLQRSTQYKVKVLSQKDSLRSIASSTTFTTANVVKASEVGARSAVIAWRTPVVYSNYRVVYQVAGEDAKEVTLEPTITEYKLTGLLPLSRYTVLVQGEKNGHHTSVVTSQFITGKLRFPFPTECSQELLNGALESGEVDVYPQGKEGRAVRVYCDMETDGGGWTVFQRRMNGKTDFYRNWSDYKAGFGNLSEEFWLGNELLRNLTSMGPVGLRVDLRSGNETAYAHYTNFSIASEERNYTLTVSGFVGTAGDSMKYHNGRPFSTRDKEPDPLGIHCAKAYMGGWWYKNCYKANLNGLYGTNSNNQGVIWIDWKGKDSSIAFTEMKFRPSRFSPATHG